MEKQSYEESPKTKRIESIAKTMNTTFTNELVDNYTEKRTIERIIKNKKNS